MDIHGGQRRQVASPLRRTHWRLHGPWSVPRGQWQESLFPAYSHLRCPQMARRPISVWWPHHGAVCPSEGTSALQSSRLSTQTPSKAAPRFPGHPAPCPSTSRSPNIRASTARSQTPDSGQNREDSEAQWVASSRETPPNLPTCLSTDPVFFRDAVRNRWWLLKIPWFLCQFSYFLAGAFSFNKDGLRFFFTFFWNRFWEFWHRRNNLSCYCRNNFSALLLCHYSLYLRCSQSNRQSQKNWRRDEHDCVASLCGHMLCRLHLDAIRLYLESVDIGFDITHCHSSRHQKWSPQWSSHPQRAARKQSSAAIQPLVFKVGRTFRQHLIRLEKLTSTHYKKRVHEISDHNNRSLGAGGVWAEY